MKTGYENAYENVSLSYVIFIPPFMHAPIYIYI